MTKYRIVTNGHLYRIQWKASWWPFWCWFKINLVLLPPPGDATSFDGIKQFYTRDAAREYIRRLRRDWVIERRKWR